MTSIKTNISEIHTINIVTLFFKITAEMLSTKYKSISKSIYNKFDPENSDRSLVYSIDFQGIPSEIT